MTVARVVGNVWATRKHPGLDRLKLLLVQPLDGETGRVSGDAALAVDAKFGAGPGDTVLLMDEGSGARQILDNKASPVRLIVCGIIDAVSVGGRDSRYH